MGRVFDQWPGNKPLGFIEGGVFLGLPSGYQLFKIIFLLGLDVIYKQFSLEHLKENGLCTPKFH
jgi:hypothetical protein